MVFLLSDKFGFWLFVFKFFLAVQEEVVKMPELPAYTNQGYMINCVF